MIDSLLQDITIYHNKERYNLRASVRNTTFLNRNRPDKSETDTTLIRIFEIDTYKKSWNIDTGDIVVLDNVNDEIETAPLTELRNKYGKEKVVEVSNKTEYLFDNYETRFLQHIKIGAR